MRRLGDALVLTGVCTFAGALAGVAYSLAVTIPQLVDAAQGSSTATGSIGLTVFGAMLGALIGLAMGFLVGLATALTASLFASGLVDVRAVIASSLAAAVVAFCAFYFTFAGWSNVLTAVGAVGFGVGAAAVVAVAGLLRYRRALPRYPIRP